MHYMIKHDDDLFITPNASTLTDYVEKVIGVDYVLGALRRRGMAKKDFRYLSQKNKLQIIRESDLNLYEGDSRKDVLQQLEYENHQKLLHEYASTKNPHDDFGDLMTIEEWNEAVSYNAFIPSDGSGYYAWENHQSELSVWTIGFDIDPYKFTHVIWYNK